jgi:hypothetical protein
LSRLALAALAGTLLQAAPAAAQNAESAADRRVIELTELQKRQTDLRDKRCYMPAEVRDEIVVCAEQEDPATQYVPSDTDSGDPDDGVPRAPDVTGLPSDGMRIGKTPRHPLIIDLTAIPEPPPGSDADKIAKGEMAAP